MHTYTHKHTQTYTHAIEKERERERELKRKVFKKKEDVLDVARSRDHMTEENITNF